MLSTCTWTHGISAVNYGGLLYGVAVVLTVLAATAALFQPTFVEASGSGVALRQHRWPLGRGRRAAAGLLVVALAVLAVNQWAYANSPHDHGAHTRVVSLN